MVYSKYKLKYSKTGMILDTVSLVYHAMVQFNQSMVNVSLNKLQLIVTQLWTVKCFINQLQLYNGCPKDVYEWAIVPFFKTFYTVL